MHLRGLDLNLLIVLDVLLEERNITRGAERLRLSQSGTSTALGRLREFFKDELLVTLGRKMVLTPLAQTLVSPVREIVLQAHTLIDSTPGFNPATAKRSFTIMCSDYVASVLLPQVVARLSREAPGVVIELTEFDDAPHQYLERGDVDFLIMPEQYLSPAHPSAKLYSDRYVCLSWSDNSRFQGDPDIEDYLSLGHVVARFGKTRGMAFDEWFTERFERVRKVEAIVMNFSMIPLYIVGTERLATVHERLACHYRSSMPVRLHRLPFEIPNITEMLQWNRFNDRHAGISWLRQILVEEAALLGALKEGDGQ